ncbi:DUF7688 family protein [Ornithobacterium rhinotracheale]
MKETDNNQIRQNGKIILSGDEISIKVIFNNLIGQNFQGNEYNDYIDYVALKQGFEKGEVELFIDNKCVHRGIIK